VLLVEDEPAVCRIASRALRKRGFHVIEAMDGIEALAAAERHDGPIDLVVSDLVMPRMGGREMMQQLLATRRGVPVLFTTGYTGTDHSASHELETTIEVLQKPYTIERLVSVVRSLVDARAHPAQPSA
jgi:CheY-like chemotaxis protein